MPQHPPQPSPWPQALRNVARWLTEHRLARLPCLGLLLAWPLAPGAQTALAAATDAGSVVRQIEQARLQAPTPHLVAPVMKGRRRRSRVRPAWW